MKILVNGCSFTAGSDVLHDPVTGRLVPNDQYTWAKMLAEDYDVNLLALGGNSNDKIFRTTAEELSKNTYDFVIVQWTGIHRKERFSEIANQWINYCNLGHVTTNNLFAENKDYTNQELYSWHIDDGKLADIDNPSNKGLHNSLERVSKAMSTDILVGKTLQDYRLEFFKNVMSAEHLIGKHNTKFLFTSMSGDNHIPYILESTPFSKQVSLTLAEVSVAKNLNLENWTTKPLSVMMDNKRISHEDAHPNTEGHKLIYMNILKEMKRING
jgi:hypothetical protein